ncbi:MAG: hypothetical protein PHX20_07275 [Candidatus Omnitrophica bacterium]|nr:hypothetical protein [Candidatus Omnitrophota bacterium]MDD5437327.1 hypothetical protein [Candidatus Omnitrophota bacterium]
MIKSVTIGEEIVVTTRNKIGILADTAVIMANNGVNIDALLGYETGFTAKLLFITSGNLGVLNELRKKKYKTIKETEVLVVELSNKPGALKVVAMELKNNKIDVRHVYITSPSTGDSSKMILQTSDNEKAMVLLSRFVT